MPRQSGVFCAVGMLFADLKHDLVRSYCASGEQLDPERWRAALHRHGRGRPPHAVVGRGASGGGGGTLLRGSPLPAPGPRAQPADGRELGEPSGNGHVASLASMPSTSGTSVTAFPRKCWRWSTCASGRWPAGPGRSFRASGWPGRRRRCPTVGGGPTAPGRCVSGTSPCTAESSWTAVAACRDPPSSSCRKPPLWCLRTSACTSMKSVVLS